MKVLRGLLVVLLVSIIIGGLGYIGWSMFFAPMAHQGMNTPPGTNNPPGTNTPNGQMPGNQHMPNMQQPAPQNNVLLNTIAIQNKDRLNQALGTINQALDLISIDPYSRTTVNSMGNMQTQPNQGSGTVNVFPSGNSTVNVVPPGNNAPNNAASSTNTNMGAMAGSQNTNYVYDQGKLQQLNNGIYTLAQGIMAVNQLGDDLTVQSAIAEPNPQNYQTYVMRYNTALQNKIKLNNAITMIDRASALVNVNPYGSPNGYQINVSEMQRFHDGVFKLAQGMTMLNRLSEDFTRQMAQAAGQAQVLANSGNMSNMPGLIMPGTGWSINLATIFNIILVVMVIGFVLGIFGAVASLFKKKTGGDERNDPGSEPNTL